MHKFNFDGLEIIKDFNTCFEMENSELTFKTWGILKRLTPLMTFLEMLKSNFRQKHLIKFDINILNHC